VKWPDCDRYLSRVSICTCRKQLSFAFWSSSGRLFYASVLFLAAVRHAKGFVL